MTTILLCSPKICNVDKFTIIKPILFFKCVTSNARMQIYVPTATSMSPSGACPRVPATDAKKTLRYIPCTYVERYIVIISQKKYKPLYFESEFVN
jgi:hypothetical protein